MTRAALPGRPSSFLIRRESAPSIRHVSSALGAEGQHQVLAGQSRALHGPRRQLRARGGLARDRARQADEEHGEASPKARPAGRAGRRCRRSANQLAVVVERRGGHVILVEKASSIRARIAGRVSTRATQTISSAAVRAAGWDRQASTSFAFMSGVRTQWNSQGWRLDEFGARSAMSSASRTSASGIGERSKTRTLRRVATTFLNSFQSIVGSGPSSDGRSRARRRRCRPWGFSYRTSKAKPCLFSARIVKRGSAPSRARRPANFEPHTPKRA